MPIWSDPASPSLSCPNLITSFYQSLSETWIESAMLKLFYDCRGPGVHVPKTIVYGNQLTEFCLCTGKICIWTMLYYQTAAMQEKLLWGKHSGWALSEQQASCLVKLEQDTAPSCRAIWRQSKILDDHETFPVCLASIRSIPPLALPFFINYFQMNGKKQKLEDVEYRWLGVMLPVDCFFFKDLMILPSMLSVIVCRVCLP